MTATLTDARTGKAQGKGLGVAPYAPLAARLLEQQQPAWLRTLRENAWKHFEGEGIPSARLEEWRFTPMQQLIGESFHLVTEGPTITSAKLPSGVRLLTMAQALEEGLPELEQHLAQHAVPEATPFSALNAALFTDGVVLVVPDGVKVPDPIRINHVAVDGELYVTRTLLILGRDAEAVVVESFHGNDGAHYFTNHCADHVLGANARLEHLRLQEESDDAWHVGYTHADQQRDSHYRSFTLGLGGATARHNLHARHRDTAVETLFYGLYLPRGSQLIDNHTAIFHEQPNCNSWEVYKGVIADEAHAVFNGKVFVTPIAQRTDAKQTNRNILLSERAKVDTKPQLEIFADDVKCTHGATVGRPDPLQRYYLQTRGIGGGAAQSLLLWAFAAEVIGEITVPELRAEVELDVRSRLDAMIG